MGLEEKFIEEEFIYEGNFLKLYKSKWKLDNGETVERDILKHPGATAIIPYIAEDKILLVKQFRASVNEILLEIPAGKIDKNEEPLNCAKRELEEETGYKSEQLELLGEIYPAPGFCDEKIYLYKAFNLKEGKQNFDFDENLELEVVTVAEIKKMVREGRIKDSKTLAAIAYI